MLQNTQLKKLPRKNLGDNMYRRIVLFLIRLKLGVRIHERFRFTNQKNPDIYFFTKRHLKKAVPYAENKYWYTRSDVGINWLLDENCKVIIVPKEVHIPK